MKQLTEAEAWVEVAKRIAKRGRPICSGMCSEVYGLGVSQDTRSSMRARIRENLALQDDAVTNEFGDREWIDTPNVEGCRVLAALFLAEEAAENPA